MNNLEKYANLSKTLLKYLTKARGSMNASPGAAGALSMGTLGGAIGANTGDGGLDNIALGALLGASGGVGVGKGLGKLDDIFAAGKNVSTKGAAKEILNNNPTSIPFKQVSKIPHKMNKDIVPEDLDHWEDMMRMIRQTPIPTKA